MSDALLGDSASESDTSVRSGLESTSSRCGGGAGCSGCEPRLAIRVVAIGGKGDEDGAAAADGLHLDSKSPRGSGSSLNNQRRRPRVQGRAVLHAGGGFSFRQDREGHEKPRPSSAATSNPLARCISWLCGGGGGGGGGKQEGADSVSYEVEASDLVGALEVPSSSNSSSDSPSSSSSSSFAPFSVSRGRLPPLRPVSSSSSSPSSPRSSSSPPPKPPPPSTTTMTSREIVRRIRAAAAPWDNQIPSDPPRPRSALAVVNPVAGGGKGLELFESLLSPMLEAAGVEVAGVVLTREKGDARRAAASADPGAVGALVAVGGDGTAAELLQGLMTRETGDSAEAARRMPLAVLPAGSGNALVLSSCCSMSPSSSGAATSSSSSSSPAAAAVCATRAAAAIARGRSAPLDVVVADSIWEEEGQGKVKEGSSSSSSPSPSSSSLRFGADGALLLLPPSSASPSSLIARRFAFLSLTYGLIANADVGTDPWRWMGPLRFTLGALREVAARRSHGLDALVVDGTALLPPPPTSSSSSASPASSSSSSVSSSRRFPGALPTPLLDSLPASALLPGGGGGGGGERERVSPPWRRLEADDAALFACCNLPRLDASTHLAPGVRRDCGSLHLVRTRGRVPRLAALRLLSEVESGTHVVSSPSKERVVAVVDKVRALLLRPLDSSRHGRLALDGEELPVGKPVACEVVPGGARLIVTEF